MNNSYSALGAWFEYLNKDCDYEKWSQYLVNALKAYGAGSFGIDIGCGNGYFTRALNRAGYRVSGADISVPMLNKAKQISAAEGVKTEFLLADITKLKLPSKVDFAVAINDCLNYVPQNKLTTAFKRVNACLKKGGLFIFDISTPYKLQNIIGSNLFAEDGEKITYLWFNTLFSDRVEMDITLFERRLDGTYVRTDEQQTQFIHDEKTVTQSLLGAGFCVIKTEGHLGAEVCGTTQRLNFICKKV